MEKKRENDERIAANKVKTAEKKAVREAQEAANALKIAIKGVQKAAQGLSPQKNNRKGRRQKQQVDQLQVDLSVIEEEEFPIIVGQAAKDSVDNEAAIGGRIDGRPSRIRKISMKLR